MAGVNRWTPRPVRSKDALPVVRVGKPCVFISYRLDDKDVAQSVARFLMDTAGSDVYFSDLDAALLMAIAHPRDNVDEEVVDAIDAGTAKSTHLLGVISNQTRGSWWVPYEFGACRMRKLEIALLLLDDVAELPSQLVSGFHLRKIWGHHLQAVDSTELKSATQLSVARINSRSSRHYGDHVE